MTNRIQTMVGAMAMTAALAGCARTELPTSPNLAPGGGSFTLSGVVTADDSGAAPLEGADIRLVPPGADPDDASQGRTVSSDAAGGFRASGLAEGSWTITVKKSGYKDQSVVVSVKRDSTVNLSLLPAAAPLAAQ